MGVSRISQVAHTSDKRITGVSISYGARIIPFLLLLLLPVFVSVLLLILILVLLILILLLFLLPLFFYLTKKRVYLFEKIGRRLGRSGGRDGVALRWGFGRDRA